MIVKQPQTNRFVGTLAAACLALLAAAAPARAADPVTVSSLLAQGFTPFGVIPSQAGPGIFLQKGQAIYACFVAEKPGSADVTTAYCKPVR